ncbi:MAG: CBS domain-containing protein [Gammaproteobacteria bacterium]|nr:CBS domain-containing protein [Gammaproteobacteria bacterium]
MLRHFFQRDPKNKSALCALLKRLEERKVFDTETLKMMEGVLQVSEMQVKDIMIPRAQMVVVQKDAEPGSFLAEIIESAHSRFPVIDGNKDEVVGILLAKDCLKICFEKKPFDLQKIVRPPLFVPENKRLDHILKEFKSSHTHMAIVVDEYGGISGLITIEDVLEQIVGEIEDEYDLPLEATIKPQKNGTYVIHAGTPIPVFNRTFQATLSDETFDTIGGLVLHAFGRLPKKGEYIEFEAFGFTVLQADYRRIRLLKVEVLRM